MDFNLTGVVILNYKTHDLTVELANQIAGFSSVDYVCVVDNCSGDSFIQEEFKYDKIIFIQNDVNGGYSYGNNVGLRLLIEEKNCEYVFVANPDVQLDENVFSAVCSYFARNPCTALCAPRRYGYGGAPIHQYFDFPTISSAIRSCFFITRRPFEKNRREFQNDRVLREKSFKVDAVPGAFFGARSSFLVEVGYMPEDIFMYGEEIVLGKQAQLAGYDSAIVCTAKYVHNHKTEHFTNIDAFINDHKSLEHFFSEFRLGSCFSRALLHLCTVFGCAEYRLAAAVYGCLKRK